MLLNSDMRRTALYALAWLCAICDPHPGSAN